MKTLFDTMLLLLCANYGQNASKLSCHLKDSLRAGEGDVLRGKTLKILTMEDYPLSGVNKTDAGLQGTGIAFELVEVLREKYGFNYEVFSLSEKEKHMVGDEKTGALSKLVKKEVDMIAAFLPIIPGSHDYITWGMDLTQAKYYVLLKRPEDSNSGSGLLAPFDKAVWVLILVSLLAVGPIMYGVMWLRIKLCPNDDNQLYPLPSCAWFVYGALLKQGSTINPAADSARMIFATWWVFILILTAFYTANLTAFLTLSLSTIPIKEIEDVAKDNNKWFALNGGSVYHAIRNDWTLSKLAQVGPSRYLYLDSKNTIEIKNKLLDGWLYLDNYYFLTRLMYQDYLEKSEYYDDESKRCQFVLTQKEFMSRPLAFAYQKDSDLPQLFNKIVQTFLESGILDHLLSEDLPDTVICPLNLGNKDRRLRNSDLFTTYAVVMSGFTCALAVFFGEILWRCYFGRSSSIKQFPKFFSKVELHSKKDPYNKIEQQARINGREYFIMTLQDGDKRLVPMRTPSALLFQ